MRLNLDSQIELCRAPQRLAQNVSFEANLRAVLDVLVLASSAPSEIGTWRIGPELRSVHNALKLPTGKSLALLDDGCLNSLTRQDEWNKHSLGALLAGLQTTEAIASIHQFFDGDLHGCHM